MRGFIPFAFGLSAVSAECTFNTTLSEYYDKNGNICDPDAPEGGRVAALLDIFQAEPLKFNIQIQEHCFFGDLPLMELTEYACQDTLESSLKDGETCPFTCKHDATLNGELVCDCENDDDLVSQSARCQWKYPDLTPICGIDRNSDIDTHISWLKTADKHNDNSLTGITSMSQQIEKGALASLDRAANNAKLTYEKVMAAMADMSSKTKMTTETREKLAKDVRDAINDLKMADKQILHVVSHHSDVVDDAQLKVAKHSEALTANQVGITANENGIDDLEGLTALLDKELKDKMASMVSMLNQEIFEHEYNHEQNTLQENENFVALNEKNVEQQNTFWLLEQNGSRIAAQAAENDLALSANGAQLDVLATEAEVQASTAWDQLQNIHDRFNYLTTWIDNRVTWLGDSLMASINNVANDKMLFEVATEQNDTNLANQLNATNAWADAEWDRNDVRDQLLDEYQSTLNYIKNNVTDRRAEEIASLSSKLDGQTEVFGLQVDAANVRVASNLANLAGAQQIVDQDLGQQIDFTNFEHEMAIMDLQAEESRGFGRDDWIGDLETYAEQLFNATGLADTWLDLVQADIKTADAKIQEQINANYMTVKNWLDGLAAELREQDGKLTWKDTELRQWLDNINFGLDAEVTLGQTQDAKLADHESRLGTAEWQLVDKQQQMDDLDANITDTFHKLGHDLEDSADAIRADLGNLTEALEDADRAIRILDTASNFRLDNLNITIQNNLTKWNDNQDAEILSQNQTMSEQVAEMAALAETIAGVANGLGQASVSVNGSLIAVQGNTEEIIRILTTVMNETDEGFESRIDTLDSAHATTDLKLLNKTIAGSARDAGLAAQVSQVAAIRVDANAHTTGINDLAKQIGVSFSIVTSELALGSDVDDQLLAELEARLTAADDELKRQDQLIRGESAADKLIVEGKLSGDLNKQETDFRTHFNNEIFNMDTKFTTSINALTVKEQEDVNEAIDTINFLNGVLRPTTYTFFSGVYQPEVGHLIGIIPYFYRIWHVEVDIMPYAANHYSWVNLLHFTASGDNYGRAGDRMPLISLYPGENKLHIACYVNNQVSYAYNVDYVMPMNQWTKLEVGQAYVQSKFVYYVKINGKQVYSIVNLYPRDFENMMIFGSDPWSEKPNAKLRNLQVTTSWSPVIVTVTEPLGTYSRSEGIEVDKEA